LKARRLLAPFVFFALTFLLTALESSIPCVRVSSVNPVTVIQIAASTEPTVYGPPSNDTSPPQSPLIPALIWGVTIAVLAITIALYARFNARHNEHSEYDDHLPPEIWSRGLHTYLQLVGRKKEEREQEAGSR